MNKDNTDELFDLKTSFYLGSYQQAINYAQKLRVSDPKLQTEKEFFMYRAFIAQKKYSVVLDDIGLNAADELRYLRLMAEYFSNESKRDSIINNLDSQLGSLNVTNALVVLIIASIYVLAENYETALKVLHSVDAATSLECNALSIQIYLKLDRFDLAKNELKKLIDADEDAIITQLAIAWVYMATNEKLDDAYYAYQELSDKHAPTSLTLNNQAACLINQGKFEEALNTLQESIDKDNNNPDAIINMAVVNRLLGKPQEVSNRFISQLKDLHRNHHFVENLYKKEREFDRIAQNFYPSVAQN